MMQVGVKHIDQDTHGFSICEWLLNVCQTIMYNGDTKTY